MHLSLHKIYTFLVPTLALLLLSSCATKGPKKIYAFPKYTPERPAPQEGFLNPTRTQPGTLMDPEALTYAQVPKRIIYLPGQHNMFNRQSAQQEVAYELVAVDRSHRIADLPSQAANPPSPTPKEQKTSPEVFKTAFMDPSGGERHGTARRLGILGKSTVEKQRAELLLREKETLEWSADAGWIGFQEERKTQLVAPPTSPMEISPADKKKDIPLPEVNPVSQPTPPPLEDPFADTNTPTNNGQTPSTTPTTPQNDPFEDPFATPTTPPAPQAPQALPTPTNPPTLSEPEGTIKDVDTLLEVPETPVLESEEVDISF